MKTQSITLFGNLGRNKLNILTMEGKENLPIGEIENNRRIFCPVDLLSIQRNIWNEGLRRNLICK